MDDGADEEILEDLALVLGALVARSCLAAHAPVVPSFEVSKHYTGDGGWQIVGGWRIGTRSQSAKPLKSQKGQL